MSAMRILGSLAALAVLAACTEPLPTDYREKYALRPFPTTVVMPMQMEQATLTGEDDARFSSLVAGYLDRGHGPITISGRVSSPDAPVPDNLIRIRKRLLAAGVPASAIRVLLTNDGALGTVVVSFERYEVALPVCGDWSSPPTFNPYNDVSANFGCAWQRDVGLMAADPADLIHKRDSTPPDPRNADRVIQRYRAGQAPGSVPNPQQLRGASGQSF